MRCTTITSAGATIHSLKILADCILEAVQCTAIAVAVSENPNLLWSDIKSPAADGVRSDVYAWHGIEADTGENGPFVQLGIPVSAGSTLFVSFSGAGSCLLYFNDPI